MPHHIVATDGAPAAIGPYSQAVRTDGLTFFSGQIALDPESGAMVGDGDVALETQQVMSNLIAVVRAAGHRVEDIAKTTIYLRTMDDFSAVNAVYEAALEGHRPARATVAVAGLPKDARVEIDAIAVRCAK